MHDDGKICYWTEIQDDFCEKWWVLRNLLIKSRHYSALWSWHSGNWSATCRITVHRRGGIYSYMYKQMYLVLIKNIKGTVTSLNGLRNKTWLNFEQQLNFWRGHPVFDSLMIVYSKGASFVFRQRRTRYILLNI